jgi:hypothetical protein
LNVFLPGLFSIPDPICLYPGRKRSIGLFRIRIEIQDPDPDSNLGFKSGSDIGSEIKVSDPQHRFNPSRIPDPTTATNKYVIWI